MSRRERPSRPVAVGRKPLPAGPAPDLCDPLPASLRAAITPMHDALEGWFKRVGRDLPWRRGVDPYRTWISEVMLQQTQVDRVVGFFLRFLERFPTVERLAAAPEAEVLRAWEGLGYYRRARQLHAAAKRIVLDHGGHLPATVPDLRALPGIGRYTAGAIASIAFDRPEPIVEANSRRVLARLAAHAAPLDGTAGDGPIWAMASALLPARSAGLWNQALMDLGATVCTPRNPLCTRCPLGPHCLALASGRVGAIPATTTRREVIELEETAVVIRRGAKVLLVRRGAGEWWEGLWDFPRLPATKSLAPLGCGRRRLVGSCRYTVTHHRVSVRVEVCSASRRGPSRDGKAWVDWDRLGTLAMTAPGRRIAALVERGAGTAGRRAVGASRARRG